MEQPNTTPTTQTGQQPQEESARWSMDRRKEAMARAMASQLAQGGRRVESQSDYNAVLVAGKPVNHILHLILTVLTLGIWGIVWLIMVVTGGEKREMVTVDEYGNTSVQKL